MLFEQSLSYKKTICSPAIIVPSENLCCVNLGHFKLQMPYSTQSWVMVHFQIKQHFLPKTNSFTEISLDFHKVMKNK